MALRVRSLEDLAPELRSRIPVVAPQQKPRSKYGNQITRYDGIRYASKLEARCAEWLDLRRAQGEVAWYIRQVPFTLEGGVVYRADFLAALGPKGGGFSCDWRDFLEVIDAKGLLLRGTASKLKQLEARYGIRVKLWPEAPWRGR